VSTDSTQRRPKRRLLAGAVALAFTASIVGIGAAVPAWADDTVPEPIVTEVVAPAETTEEVVEEEVAPEETTPVEETPAVPEEEVAEELVAPQGFSTQTAKNDGEQGQETCPDGGGWLKIEPIDALTYEYTAPDGQLIAEVCYKASTEVIYIDIEDAASYEFVSTVTNKNGELQEISHVSVRLITDDSTCVDDPVFSYTFDPATGSGDVTVTGGEEGEELCAPLYIRAAAWTYDLPASGSPSWPQTLYGTPGDTTVNAIGVFSYGPPQLDSCRQYDVYASFGGFGELELPTYLDGSHDPFEPAFLHETLNGLGPNPTYSFTSSEGCNEEDPTEVEPASPIKVDLCGVENDSFTLPGAEPNEMESVTAEGTYTADDLPTEDGTVAVTFVPADGTVVKDDPNAEYEVDENGNAVWILVFTDEPCLVVKPAVQHVVVCGVDNDTVTTPGTAVENAEGITETEEFYYVIDPDGTDTPGTINVLAIPKDGVVVAEPGDGDTYVIDGDGNASWTFVDDDAACPSPGLALTGSNPMPLVGFGALLLAIGTLAVAGARRKVTGVV
jgi:hypothetical protein